MGINQHEMIFVHGTTGTAAVYLMGGLVYQEDMIGAVIGDILRLKSETSGWEKFGKMLYPRHSHRSWVTYDFDEANPTYKTNPQIYSVAGRGPMASANYYLEKITILNGEQKRFQTEGLFDPTRDSFDTIVFTNGGLNLDLLPNYSPHC